MLSLFSIYGNVIKHETTLHDLRNRVELLQNKQALHLAELKGEIVPDLMGDIETLDDPPELDPEDIPDSIEINVVPDGDQFSAEPVSSETSAA